MLRALGRRPRGGGRHGARRPRRRTRRRARRHGAPQRRRWHAGRPPLRAARGGRARHGAPGLRRGRRQPRACPVVDARGREPRGGCRAGRSARGFRGARHFAIRRRRDLLRQPDRDAPSGRADLCRGGLPRPSGLGSSRRLRGRPDSRLAAHRLHRALDAGPEDGTGACDPPRACQEARAPRPRGARTPRPGARRVPAAARLRRITTASGHARASRPQSLRSPSGTASASSCACSRRGR